MNKKKKNKGEPGFDYLNFSGSVQDALWQFIQRGGIRIEQSEENIYFRIRELMNKYHLHA